MHLYRIEDWNHAVTVPCAMPNSHQMCTTDNFKFAQSSSAHFVRIRDSLRACFTNTYSGLLPHPPCARATNQEQHVCWQPRPEHTSNAYLARRCDNDHAIVVERMPGAYRFQREATMRTQFSQHSVAPQLQTPRLPCSSLTPEHPKEKCF